MIGMYTLYAQLLAVLFYQKGANLIKLFPSVRTNHVVQMVPILRKGLLNPSCQINHSIPSNLMYVHHMLKTRECQCTCLVIKQIITANITNQQNGTYRPLAPALPGT